MGMYHGLILQECWNTRQNGTKGKYQQSAVEMYLFRFVQNLVMYQGASRCLSESGLVKCVGVIMTEIATQVSIYSTKG